MENASKALLIAGAILLVILIISLGLVVYNQAKESVGNANLDQQEIEAFNSKITPFEGNQVSGSQVNRLIQTVISSNQAELNASTGKYIAICFESVSPYGNNYNSSVVFMAVDKAQGKVQYAIAGYDSDNTNLYSHALKEAKSGDTNDINGTAVPEWKDTCSAALKVNEGINYKVQYLYTNGLVDRIVVEKN